MSHFMVAVMAKDEEDIGRLLEPYDENLEVEPYVQCRKNELLELAKEKQKRLLGARAKEILEPVEMRILKAETDEELYWAYREFANGNYDEEGNEVTTYNPLSKWDWYMIGGRYTNRVAIDAGNPDVIGVELGGSLKNVIAIASGFAHSMELGDNCMGSLLTRGMAEIVRLAVKLGANPSTMYGLSGMGDLIATCSSPLSRNYTVGSMLGKGKKIDDILSELGSVAEGVKTSKAVCDLAKKLDLEVPVSSAIYEAVYTDITPQEVLSKLMNRKLKKEECYDKVCG